MGSCDHTLISGVPCEKPVPTGCSTNSTLDRFVQLNSLMDGFALPQGQEKGLMQQSQLGIPVVLRALTPFSCKTPSRDEHPGPPLVLSTGLADQTGSTL